MIRRAKLHEIPDIFNISRSCGEQLINKGIYQWNVDYPSYKAFHTDQSRNELYILENNANVIGAITITEVVDEEYLPVKWLTASGNNIYIHRLCVAPNHQGKGFAQKLMDFAEKYARDNHFLSVRLDTFSQNIRNQLFYEHRGYQKVGNIFFLKQSEHAFYCYELVL